MEKETGYLLSYTRYGDNDAVLRCFTQQGIFRSYFIKGIYAAKGRKKAYLYPFSQVCLTVSGRENTNTLPQAYGMEPVSEDFMGQDVRLSSVLFFMADFLNQVLQKDSRHPTLYHTISKLLAALSAGHYSAHLLFLVELLRHLGIAPLPGEAPFLDPETGSFSFAQTSKFFDEATSTVLKSILSEDSALDFEGRIPARRQFLDGLIFYYSVHFPGFRLPISLEVVREIFE